MFSDTTHFVHISCGNLNVWAVDNEGATYQRIGVKPPNDHSLNAAWLPVDNGGTVFTQIIAGPQDWMVSFIIFDSVHGFRIQHFLSAVSNNLMFSLLVQSTKELLQLDCW